VLVTRFLDGDGVGEVIDFMLVGAKDGEHGAHQLVRRVRVVRGKMGFRRRCRPAFNFPARPTELRSGPKAPAS
jgi:hypothetical protein